MSRAPTDAVVSLAAVNPINAAVLKMVLDSPVGKSMSDGDRVALTQTLTTTDVREVQGWLGEQIRKAARDVVKGDYVGHPFRGNQYADASGASTGGAGGTPNTRGKRLGRVNPDFDDKKFRELFDADQKAFAGGKGKGGRTAGNAKMSGKAKVDTMFSESDNKKVADAFSKFIKDKKFPADYQITSDDINEFADSLKGKVGSEVNDTAVREQLAEQYHERTGIPYKAREDRDASNRAKREAVREKREQERAKAEQREAKENERRSKLVPLTDDDITRPLTGTEAADFKAGVKDTKAALKKTDALISALRTRLNTQREQGKISMENAREAMFAIDEAQESADRIRSAVEGSRKPTFGLAQILTMRSVNEAETAKGAIRDALRLTGAKSSHPNDDALQSAMDRDFGVSSDKYDVDGMDMDKIFDLSDSLGR